MGSGEPRSAKPEARSATSTSRRRAGIALALALGAVGVAAVLVARHRPAPPPQREVSVAVLPFASEGASGDDRDFAEGFSDELFGALVRVEGLRLAARNSAFAVAYRSRDPRRVGRTLAVESVVDATVGRIGDRVRVDALMADARSGRTRWTKRYERPQAELLGLRVELATDIVALLLGASAAQAAVVPPTDPASGVYGEFVRARRVLEDRDDGDRVELAIGLFREVVAADSGYARAQAGLCEAQVFRFLSVRDVDELERARAACTRALELDPALPAVQLAQARLDAAEGAHAAANERFGRAMDDPALRIAALIGLAEVAAAQGATPSALGYFDRARGLQPDYWETYFKIGRFLIGQQRYPEAIAALSAAAERVPEGNTRIWNNLGATHLLNGDEAGAAAAFSRSLDVGETIGALSNLGTLRFMHGAYAEAAALYRRAIAVEPGHYPSWSNLGDALSADPATASHARAAYAKAAPLIENYIAIAHDAEAVAMLGWVRANLGERDTAIALIARAERMNAAPGDVALWGAQTFALLGDNEGALARVARARAAGVSERRLSTVPTLRRLAAQPPTPS